MLMVRLVDLAISIHVPREGDDLIYIVLTDTVDRFQSTSPVRGTTPTTPVVPAMPYDFNPRPP